MRVGRRLAKILVWLLVLGVAILSGGLCFMYSYMTDSATAARVIREYAVKYLRNSELIPGHVQDQTICRRIGASRDPPAAEDRRSAVSQRCAFPGCRCSSVPARWPRAKIDLREVQVSHPTLRLKRRRDGTWNIQGLLVSPWPGPWLEHSPPIFIQNGRVELSEDEEPMTRRAGHPRRPSPASQGRQAVPSRATRRSRRFRFCPNRCRVRARPVRRSCAT